MIELEIPASLVEIRGHEDDRTKLRYGSRLFDHWQAPWICLRPDVEEWITKNFKAKHRRDVKVSERPLKHYLAGERKVAGFGLKHVRIVQFRDKRDATLFKLFWL